MITYPNAKINLGLSVLRKRSDAYHDIDSVFYPIPWRDILEVIPSQKRTGLEMGFSGIPVPGNYNDNLCFKAYELLRDELGIGAAQMHLHKCIPMGAGLGGGSADAAFMLKELNRVFSLQLDEKKLEQFAARLGSDCPFFIRNRPAYVTGRGEKMEHIELDLTGYSLLLINPGLHIGTAEAYSGIQPKETAHSNKTIVQHLSPEEWNYFLKNDFEQSAFARFPELKRIKQALYSNGALYASMTGSGSTMYGLFRKGEELPETIFAHAHYAVKSIPSLLC